MLKLKNIIKSLIPVIFYICKIFKIKSNKVIFNNYYGSGYGDNLKYICNELLKQNKYDIVWVVKNDDIKVPEGIRTIKIKSIKYIYELATAKVWIDNCRKEYYVRKRNGQYYIQTWHGSIGYKKVEKSASDVLSKDYIKCAINDSKMADLFIAANEFSANLYKRDFWYDGEILKCGYPRNDIIVNNDVNVIKNVRNYFKLDDNKKIVLYAPTFRKDMSLDAYNIDYSKLIKTLKDKYNEEYVVLLRLHPNVANKSDMIKYNKNVLNASNYPDMQELMLAADILITDYSSCIFDFALTLKKAFIYATDIEEYIKDRDFEINYTDTPFSVSQNNKELLENVMNFDEKKYKKDVKAFYEKIGSYENGAASKKVVERIIDVIESDSKNEKRK